MKLTLIARDSTREQRHLCLKSIMTVADNVRSFRGPTDMSDNHGEFTTLTSHFLSPGEINEPGPAPSAA